MNHFLATMIGVIGVVASPLIHAGVQRTTGDQAVRLARATREKTAEAIMADRRSKCYKAIGSPVFCDCLNGSLPLATDFQKYITVTTATSAAQLPPDDQKVASVILAVRDRCVASAFSTPK